MAPAKKESKRTEEMLVEFIGVNLGYGKNLVLTDVTFSIRKGQFWALVGPNGSGKTTLLPTLLGILRPVYGKTIFGEGGKRLSSVGYVQQRGEFQLEFPLSVMEVASMGLRLKGRAAYHSGASAIKRAVEDVGISEFAYKSYWELSGGQKQRVLVARALASEPDVLILDEPTNGLDLGTEQNIMRLISRLHKERGVTTIFVTHSLNLAAQFATHVAIFNKGTVTAGSSDETLTSENISAIYGTPVAVRVIDGIPAILPGGENVQ